MQLAARNKRILFIMMSTPAANFIDAKTALPLLTQLIGPRRFQAFTNEAELALQKLEYSAWSPYFLADFISEEMRKPSWNKRQPTIKDYEKMVVESRKKCVDYELTLVDSNSTITFSGAHLENDFDFAKVILSELIDYFGKGATSLAKGPPIYVLIQGSNLYEEIKLSTSLSGVWTEISFIKIQRDEESI
jgi:hypothetical protein